LIFFFPGHTSMIRSNILFIVLSLLVMYRVAGAYSSFASYAPGQDVRVSGHISSEPIPYETSQRIIVADTRVYLPAYPEVSYGDYVVIEGKIDGMNLKNPKLVDYRQSDGFLYIFRQKLLDFYKKNLPEPHASLVAGVTIGSRSGMPPDFWENLKASGTAHVVVASGMNVTLVAGFLLGLMVLVTDRRKALVVALVGIWVYSVIAGFEAPIVRAAIMGSIAFTAQELGRLSYAFRALIVSALLILIYKPLWITDLGFILSVSATASLIIFEKKIRQYLGRVPGIIREDFSTSLSAQILVAPVLLFVFGRFNILSPVINAMVLWTIVPVTMLGLVGGLVGLIIEPIGTIILYSIYPLTWWFVWIVELFS
jgi:ComEC/Rec2-related protein